MIGIKKKKEKKNLHTYWGKKSPKNSPLMGGFLLNSF